MNYEERILKEITRKIRNCHGRLLKKLEKEKKSKDAFYAVRKGRTFMRRKRDHRAMEDIRYV